VNQARYLWQNRTKNGTVPPGTTVPVCAVSCIRMQAKRLNRHQHAGIHMSALSRIEPMRHYSHQRRWCG